MHRYSMHPVGQLALGVLIGDFLVAFGHWFEDQYFDQDTPYIGTVGRDNVFHHYVPFAMTTGSSVENMYTTLGLTITGLAALWLLAPRVLVGYPVLVAAASVVTVTSNALHRIQHERPCRQPRWFKTLASFGVLESSADHKAHHERPDGRYGVVLGFTNPVYDGLGIWRALEVLVPLEKKQKRPYAALEAELPEDIRRLVRDPCPDHIPRDRIDALKAELTGPR